ncbi:hypothetical protein [Actinoallomurus sp. NPDC050550]|uniref:hypothetical protein n=1 Tax=Actinoallomurus sp. NPDC050550 TaxID=3154937 RepID=UPI0033E8A594
MLLRKVSRLPLGVGAHDRFDVVDESVDEGGDCGFAHRLLPRSVLWLRPGGVALLLGLGDTSSDDRRVNALVQSFQDSSVPYELALAFGDGLLRQGGDSVLSTTVSFSV